MLCADGSIAAGTGLSAATGLSWPTGSAPGSVKRPEGGCRERCVKREGGPVGGVVTTSNGKVLTRNPRGSDAEMLLPCPYQFRVDPSPQDRRLVRNRGQQCYSYAGPGIRHQRLTAAGCSASWIARRKGTSPPKTAVHPGEALCMSVNSGVFFRLRLLEPATPSIIGTRLVLASRIYTGSFRRIHPDNQLWNVAFRLSTLRAPIRSLVRMLPQFSARTGSQRS